VLHQGVIVEEGTHQQLLQQENGFYVKLSKMQMN
jgi:ABC-type multidrug transport system fused ATPase/permease subunit